MSNLSGNYKISAGEVQGVDVAREQERRARLQLLDEIREPSPQPIFGEPVKVELEDETSRRIKNTLGDFTQVLVNDSKSLLGIARSGGQGLPNGRGPTSAKRPPAANGAYKPPPPGAPKHPALAKRPGYHGRPPEPPIAFHPSQTDPRQKDPSQWHQPRKQPSLNGTPQGNPLHPGSRGRQTTPSFSCPTSSSSSSRSNPSPGAAAGGLAPGANPGPAAGHRYGDAPASCATPPKRINAFRPTLKLPMRKPEQPAESPIELETILREMKQAVPPPLTAIQTPKTEENGFAFPVPEPKEDIRSPKIKETKPTKISEPVPQTQEPPKQTENLSYQSSSSPCTNQTLDTSLQDDLEVSDSDDEPVITEVRSGNSATFKESPLNASHPIATVSTKVMDEPEAVPSNSSSSESGDSDSNDSSSESNDSDSSASSEASDADTPSKMWGLSNFFDESRRNHSPAFVPMDTSTNSSTAAVKEDPVVTPSNPKESYSIIDDDLGPSVLHNPVPDPIPNLFALNTPVNIKSEILSPITSPLQQSSGQPPVIRGPRTPPLPAYPKGDIGEGDTGLSSKVLHDESSFTIELQSQNSKLSNAVHNVCDNKDEVGKVQISGAKKQRLCKNKCDGVSPKSLTSPLKQSHQDIEPSASKGLCDPVLSEDEIDSVKCAMPSSCSVPSETTESSHENYPIKTRQKITKSSNSKLNVANNESFGGNGQKEISTKPSAGPKFKTPVRTCRASTETKQSSKAHKSSKVNQAEESKKSVNKSDSKDKGSPEKTKLSKPVKNVKGVSKSSQKVKKKLSKSVSKHSVDVKKSESKKKRNKFHIANFLQSPTGSQNETAQPAARSSVSPSPEKSPMPSDYTFDAKRKPSVSPHRPSLSVVKVNQKSPEKAKSSEKLRRSTRCSDRLSASMQSESSSLSQQHSDLNKKPGKRTPKLKGILPELEDPPQLLSPIPLTSPKPSVFSGCAIPNKIMVCIPLSKLSRLPVPVHGLDSDCKPAGKSRSHFVNSSVPRKDELSSEKEQKSDINKCSVVKDIKDKPRTDSVDKISKTKSAKTSRKEKTKQIEHVEPVKTKSSSPVNSKTSIKSKSPRTVDEPADLKKRKGDEDKHAKKKMKTYPDPAQESQHSSIVLESPGILPELSTKTKSLERCDSLSSLSSLSSQISQKSSKGKKSSSTSDSKKDKTASLPKHIKQEKEEKLKPVIKKEPPSPEKVKERCKVDVCSSDLDMKPSLEHLHLPSSQQLPYYPWEVSNKDDLKGFLPLNTSHCITRDLDWDHFPEMNKEMKKASNKHNDTIMPMDYYYTEGRKQKQLAEREKDPFLQAIKFFEATVLFILTSQQREEYTKELDSVYQFYRETLNFSNVILQNAHIQHSSPGSTEFKVLILLLRCQALLHVKLYSLKIKEIKEQQKAVSDFFMTHCSATVKSLSHPTPLHPRLNLMSVPSSPHSPPQSPASSINSQTSGYCSSDLNGNHMKNVLSLSQHMLEMICRQHTHLINLHMGHDLWEQADMYMTRSNLREFFKEVADLSETLTLHSSIKDLVSYIQTGISLVKKCSR